METGGKWYVWFLSNLKTNNCTFTLVMWFNAWQQLELQYSVISFNCSIIMEKFCSCPKKTHVLYLVVLIIKFQAKILKKKIQFRFNVSIVRSYQKAGVLQCHHQEYDVRRKNVCNGGTSWFKFTRGLLTTILQIKGFCNQNNRHPSDAGDNK